MHDLATIQRMNREAIRKHDLELNKKVNRVYDQLDEMLYQWENFEIGDVSHFIQEWASLADVDDWQYELIHYAIEDALEVLGIGDE